MYDTLFHNFLITFITLYHYNTISWLSSSSASFFAITRPNTIRAWWNVLLVWQERLEDYRGLLLQLSEVDATHASQYAFHTRSAGSITYEAFIFIISQLEYSCKFTLTNIDDILFFLYSPQDFLKCLDQSRSLVRLCCCYMGHKWTTCYPRLHNNY